MYYETDMCIGPAFTGKAELAQRAPLLGASDEYMRLSVRRNIESACKHPCEQV